MQCNNFMEMSWRQLGVGNRSKRVFIDSRYDYFLNFEEISMHLMYFIDIYRFYITEFFLFYCSAREDKLRTSW